MQRKNKRVSRQPHEKWHTELQTASMKKWMALGSLRRCEVLLQHIIKTYDPSSFHFETLDAMIKMLRIRITYEYAVIKQHTIEKRKRVEDETLTTS